MTAAVDTWADALEEDELVTLAQIGDALGLDRTTLHGWVKRRLLEPRYVSDAGHPMYSLAQAHAIRLRIKLRGQSLDEAAAGRGWTRPRAGQPWVLSGAR